MGGEGGKMKPHKDQHTKAVEHAAAIEARTDRKRVRFTMEQAEALAKTKTQEQNRLRRKRGHLSSRKRAGLKSKGLSWLTTFQRAVYLAFTGEKRYGLPRGWFGWGKVKLPKEGL